MDVSTTQFDSDSGSSDSEASSRVRTAWVTGASRGIGAAIARCLAQTLGSQLRLVLVARSQKSCEALGAELQAEFGTQTRALALDLADRAALRAGLSDLGSWGVPDWLVNNAGMAVSAPFGAESESSETLDPDSVDGHLALNFHAPRLLMERFVSTWRERDYGRVVNVASSAALFGYPYVSAYCASKHALLGHARAVAKEWERKDLCLNTICPHFVDSPMTDQSVERIVAKTGRSPEEAREILAQQNPSGSLVLPSEVAQEVLSCLTGKQHGLVIELLGAGQRKQQT